jgi:hypothetical protein
MYLSTSGGGDVVANKKPGRKSKWELLEMDDKIILVEGWIRDGHTEKSICETLGVSHNTWNEWKNNPTKKEFREAIKKGREMVLRLTENALYKKAWGYEVEEVEVFKDADGNIINEKTKTKHIAPDTTSIIFALKNLEPDKWKDQRHQNVHHSGGVSFQSLSDEELEEELRKLEENE